MNTEKYEAETRIIKALEALDTSLMDEEVRNGVVAP
jgi:hypothetical protein